MQKKADKPKLDINAVLAAADDDKSRKTFHGADKKAEQLERAASKNGAGRKTKKEADKAKQFVLYLTPEQRADVEKAAAIMGQKSPQKWANDVLLKLTKVINQDNTNKLLLLGLLNDKQ